MRKRKLKCNIFYITIQKSILLFCDAKSKLMYMEENISFFVNDENYFPDTSKYSSTRARNVLILLPFV